MHEAEAFRAKSRIPSAWIKLPSAMCSSRALCIWADAWYLYGGSIPSTDPSFFQFECFSFGTQNTTSQAIRGVIIACSLGQHKDMRTMSWIWSKSVHVLYFANLMGICKQLSSLNFLVLYKMQIVSILLSVFPSFRMAMSVAQWIHSAFRSCDINNYLSQAVSG